MLVVARGVAAASSLLRVPSMAARVVNCDGDSEVEGDVFWTMYPKYKLSY